MDFDPRDFGDERDPRDRDRDERDRDDDDLGLSLGRGPSSVQEHHQARERDDERQDARDRADHGDGDDARWPERDRDPRDRGADPREPFTRSLNLPRGRDRETVHDARDREYTLRGSESRSLAAVGAFRVVPAGDLRDDAGRPGDARDSDLRHLREQGLIKTVRIPGHREQAVVLTDRGRSVLEASRDRDRDTGQAFYAGLKREREVEHDAQIYRAYEREAAKLESRGLEIDRVRLDYELKREYQQWLQERNRDRPDADGRPDRDEREIDQWARDHDLPFFDGQVHFPDCRIEYRDIDGREDHLDVEVVTEHYRGAHGAAVARSGFSCYRGGSARIGGGGGGSRGGGGAHGGLAEEMLE
jgi:DNA-binding MarR family transcriptional regulator